jgi:hypothetical protein
MYAAMSMLSLFLASLTLAVHFALRRFPIEFRFAWLGYAVLASMPVVWSLHEVIGRERIPMLTFVGLIASCGILAYVAFSELLMRGAAEWLNDRRKPWVKELEYVYLLFGIGGLIVSINRMEMMEGKIEWLGVLGPLIVTLAVVVKLVKVRAEVYGWNDTETLRAAIDTSARPTD